MTFLGKLTMLNVDPSEKNPKDVLETHGNEGYQFCKLYQLSICFQSVVNISIKEYDYFNKPQTSKTKGFREPRCNTKYIYFEWLGVFSQFSFPTMPIGGPSLVPRGLMLYKLIICYCQLTNCLLFH
jgi:hypothetical protein